MTSAANGLPAPPTRPEPIGSAFSEPWRPDESAAPRSHDDSQSESFEPSSDSDWCEPTESDGGLPSAAAAGGESGPPSSRSEARLSEWRAEAAGERGPAVEAWWRSCRDDVLSEPRRVPAQVVCARCASFIGSKSVNWPSVPRRFRRSPPPASDAVDTAAERPSRPPPPSSSSDNGSSSTSSSTSVFPFAMMRRRRSLGEGSTSKCLCGRSSSASISLAPKIVRMYRAIFSCCGSEQCISRLKITGYSETSKANFSIETTTS